MLVFKSPCFHLIRAPKGKRADAGSSDVPKRSRKVLPVRGKGEYVQDRQHARGPVPSSVAEPAGRLGIYSPWMREDGRIGVMPMWAHWTMSLLHCRWRVPGFSPGPTRVGQELFEPARGSGSPGCVARGTPAASLGPHLQEAATFSPLVKGTCINSLFTKLPPSANQQKSKQTQTLQNRKQSLARLIVFYLFVCLCTRLPGHSVSMNIIQQRQSSLHSAMDQLEPVYWGALCPRHAGSAFIACV